MEFQDKIVIVTGAASGMGRAAAQAFSDQGAHVYAVDLHEEPVREAFAGADRVVPLGADIADSAAVRAVFDRVESDHGRLDVLINAAGINTPNRAATEWLDGINAAMIEDVKAGRPARPEFLSEISDDDFARVMEVNVHGTFYCLRAGAPLLKAAGGGAIVNFASIAGLVGMAMPAYYPASKAAIVGMTRSVAAELAPFEIRVNALAPAGINTPLMTQSGSDHVDFLLSAQPLKRLAEPEEIVGTLLFLASDAGAHYTGQVLSPSGGALMA